jgi:hypothetical protein
METISSGMQIRLVTEDRIGAIADLADSISGSGFNIEGISVSTSGGKAFFCLVTDSNSKVRRLLEEKGYGPEEEEVLILSLENRPGALLKVAQKLRDEGIDVKSLYGTTSGEGNRTTLVLSSDKNEKAIEVLKFILSLSDWTTS